MADHPCRCETCTDKETVAPDKWGYIKSKCKKTGEVLRVQYSNDISTYSTWEASLRFGLCCHTQAREYLMQPVLKKLERAVDIETPISECDDLILEAITIIKNGVDGK